MSRTVNNTQPAALRRMRGNRRPSARNIATDEESRIEILAAAARTFMINGYSGSSIDMIAEEIGCTKGKIYYKYRGKADLFFDVHCEAMRKNMDAVAPIAQGKKPADERLRRMVESQLVLIMENLPFQRVLIQGVEMHLAGSTTAMQREILDLLIRQRDEYEGLFVRVVAEGVQEKLFRPVDPRLFSKVLLGSMTWIVTWYRHSASEPASAKQRLARELSDYMLNGLVKLSSMKSQSKSD